MVGNTNILAVRVHEWTEWLPQLPDEATGGEVFLTRGATFLELNENERLVDVHVQATNQKTRRRVKDQEILDKDTSVHPEEAPELTFVLWSFTAIIATKTDATEIEHLVIEAPKMQSQLVTAQPGQVPVK